MTKKKQRYIRPAIESFCAKEDVSILSGSSGSSGGDVKPGEETDDPNKGFGTKQSSFFFDDEKDYDDEDDSYKW